MPLKKRSSSPASAEARIPKKLSPRSPRTSEAFKATEEALLARRLSQIRERVREKEEAARLSAAISRVAQKVAGDAQGRSSGAFNRYLARITTLIEANLVIPEVIKDPSRLSATVVVVIDAQGHLRRLSFEKTSGHRLFDEAVRRAVYLAAPFPPPPSELSPPLEIGVVVRPLRLIKEES
ncbi:TonB family protein [Thermosulfuriphilus sp.]